MNDITANDLTSVDWAYILGALKVTNKLRVMQGIEKSQVEVTLGKVEQIILNGIPE